MQLTLSVMMLLFLAVFSWIPNNNSLLTLKIGCRGWHYNRTCTKGAEIELTYICHIQKTADTGCMRPTYDGHGIGSQWILHLKPKKGDEAYNNYIQLNTPIVLLHIGLSWRLMHSTDSVWNLW